MAFGLHHMFMPFDVTGKDLPLVSLTDPEAMKQRQARVFTKQLLHRLERNSILVCALLIWAATVFILHLRTLGLRCDSGGCYALVVLVILTNVLFLVSGFRLFLKYFVKRHAFMRLLLNGNEERISKWNHRLSRSLPSSFGSWHTSEGEGSARKGSSSASSRNAGGDAFGVINPMVLVRGKNDGSNNNNNNNAGSSSHPPRLPSSIKKRSRQAPANRFSFYGGNDEDIYDVEKVVAARSQ